jgi:hypothetical protein
MFPAATYVKPEFVMRLLALTPTLSVGAAHWVTLADSRLAQMSQPKLNPQQPAPLVAALCSAGIEATSAQKIM